MSDDEVQEEPALDADERHDPEDHREGDRHHHVRDRPGEGNQCHRPTSALQRRRVHHHRLRPAESGDHQHERADRIEVRDRVERQAAHGPRTPIPQLIGRQRVAELVEGQADEQCDDPRDQALD